MKLYQLSCSKCGSVSPEYRTRVSARYHDCKHRCLRCDWRKAAHGKRGLCSSCFTTPVGSAA